MLFRLHEPADHGRKTQLPAWTNPSFAIRPGPKPRCAPSHRGRAICREEGSRSARESGPPGGQDTHSRETGACLGVWRPRCRGQCDGIAGRPEALRPRLSTGVPLAVTKITCMVAPTFGHRHDTSQHARQAPCTSSRKFAEGLQAARPRPGALPIPTQAGAAVRRRTMGGSGMNGEGLYPHRTMARSLICKTPDEDGAGHEAKAIRPHVRASQRSRQLRSAERGPRLAQLR